MEIILMNIFSTRRLRSEIQWSNTKCKTCLADIWYVNSYLWWLGRVTLVVVFGFLLQKFLRCWGPTNGALLLHECNLSGGDNIICLNILHSQAVMTEKHPAYKPTHSLPIPCSHPCVQRWLGY